MSKDHLSKWEHEYQNGRGNRYPFDEVVSFVFEHFGSLSTEERLNCSILDFGCGGGNHVKFLKDLGFDYWGADGAPTAIDLTQKLINEPNSERIKLCDFLDLPFMDNQLDAVIDRQAIGHNVIGDIKQILSEVNRVLKPGGLLHSHVFGEKHSGFSYGEQVGAKDFAKFKGGHFQKSHLVHAFDIDEILDLYSGWDLVSVLRKDQQYVVGDSDNKLAESYIIVARKVA